MYIVCTTLASYVLYYGFRPLNEEYTSSACFKRPYLLPLELALPFLFLIVSSPEAKVTGASDERHHLLRANARYDEMRTSKVYLFSDINVTEG